MNKTTEALLARIAKLESAAKLAEEALDMARKGIPPGSGMYGEALAAIREALAEPMQHEPLCEDEGCPHHGTPHICFSDPSVLTEPVKCPQNCGTGYCSCIECIYGDGGFVADEGQCDDGCLYRESTIKEALKLADEIDAEFCQGRISNHNGRKAAQMIRLLVDAPVQPVKQEQVAFMFKVKRTTAASTVLDEFAAIDYFPQDGEEIVSKEPLSYAAPVDAKAIRAEALEEAAKWLADSGLIGSNDCAAAVRGMK